jgi:hypothetical protein
MSAGRTYGRDEILAELPKPMLTVMPETQSAVKN